MDKLTNGIAFKYLKKDSKFGKRYISDFIFNNQYVIEIKSTYILQKQGGKRKINAKIRSVKDKGYNFILLLDNNLENFKLIVNELLH